MARTTEPLVRGILGANWDGSTSLKPYIDSATNLVTQAISLAAQNGRGTIDSTTAELMERWLAAYNYCKMDPTYVSKSTGGASGSFAGGGSSLNGEQDRYKRGAIEADWTGTLNALLNRQVAGFDWLGKPPSDQINYSDRN